MAATVPSEGGSRLAGASLALSLPKSGIKLPFWIGPVTENGDPAASGESKFEDFPIFIREAALLTGCFIFPLDQHFTTATAGCGKETQPDHHAVMPDCIW